MAKPGDWNEKSATLSEVTAQKEYGVDREFIVKGMRAGDLEYREVERRQPGFSLRNPLNVRSKVNESALAYFL
jgi:hypothetical protein